MHLFICQLVAFKSEMLQADNIELEATKASMLFEDISGLTCHYYCVCVPEHQVYTYDDSESPRGQTVQLTPRPPDAISLLSESSQRPSQRRTLRDKGNAEPREKAPDEQEEQDPLKLSRCFSDPGPN